MTETDKLQINSNYMHIFKIKKIVLLVMLLNLVNSCYNGPYSAPRIDLENNSAYCKKIKNVKVNWNGYWLLGASELGGSSSESHIINNFFGPVHVYWENEKGKKLEKTFIFNKEEMPNYHRRHKRKFHTFINLYFNQTDMQYLSSDHPNYESEKKRIEGDWMWDKTYGTLNGKRVFKGMKCVKNAKKKWRTIP